MQYINPADQRARRRQVHPSQKQIHVHPITAPLYVVTVLFNPQRYQSRYKHWLGFEKHCIDSGAIPYTVEIALRDRHHEVTKPHLDTANEVGQCGHIQLRSESELWFKENGGNVGVSWLPHDWEYVAFVDADFLFTRPDWATETVHMLQHYDAVQMFKKLTYETADHDTHNTMHSFAYLHCNQHRLPNAKEYAQRGAVGGAWAFRRSALEKLGGLLEVCILGSGDWHMAFALAMRDDYHPEMKFDSIPQYVKAIQDWRARARDLRGNIGYVDAHAIHFWHGPLRNRGYDTRWKILTDNHFDPYLDLAKDWQGLLRLTKHKPALRDGIRRYFAARNEDSIDL